MEQQIHSMPCVKPSTEHQLSRALLTLQWNMHQMVLLLWYIVQKLATGQQKISSRSTFRIPASHYMNRVYFLFSLCRVFTLIPNIIFTWRGIKVLIRIRKSQVKRALRRWSDPVFFFWKRESIRDYPACCPVTLGNLQWWTLYHVPEEGCSSE